MKNFSIIMCFVAVFAAIATFIVVLNSNKAHDDDSKVASSQKAENKTPVKAEVPYIPSQIKIGSSQVIESPVQLPSVEEPQGPPPVSQNTNGNEIPVEPPIPTPPELPDRLYDPNSSVIFATGDLLTIPKADQPYIRYISLYNIPKSRRKEMGALISFVCNSLGTRRKMYIPEFVGASDETLIRVDIRNYDWNASAWENLAKKGSGPKPQPEPYFHAFIEKPILEKVKVKKQVKEVTKVPYLAPNGAQYRDTNGQLMFQNKEVTKEIEVEEVVSNKRERTFAIAPWLDQLGMKTLVSYTFSESPIVRADWFVANATLAPAYYDFLKLGNNIKDFENLVFANEELARKARSQDKGVVVTSIVARNNRTLNRSPTFTNGYYWRSHDSKTSVDDRNYVQFILDENFDATEDIATLPNGLQAYFLTDGKGKRLDAADIEIAVDSTAIDRVVRTGRSCMVCHSDGIRPINDAIRTLSRKLQNREQVRLLTTRKEDALRIEDLFSSDLDEQIVKDQNLYRQAVAKATGLNSEVISRMLNYNYNEYAEKLLTMESISREVGVNLSELEAYITASKDSLILGLVKTPIFAVRRDQWEQSYQRFMILIMARKRGLEHADPYPPGPLVVPPKP